MKKTSSSLLLLFVLLALLACSSDDPQVEPVVDDTPRLNKSDSINLIKIYEAIGPWSEEWDYNDITTWNGVRTALDVETNELRVIGFEIWRGGTHGQIPDEICNLTELRRLVLAHHRLSGPIPERIGNLKHLYFLAIGDNNVEGSIPESIGNLTELVRLDIINTQVSGPIPESIGNLVNLETIYMFNNRLSGSVPKGLANLSKLKQASFTDNCLSGVFPIEILKNKSANLQFQFRNNEITELPFEVWDDGFDGVPPNLQNNKLSGEVPAWVFETEKWKVEGDFCTRGQKKGYGYTNVVYQ